MHRSLPDEDRRGPLAQLGEDSADLSSQEVAELALMGQALDDLAQEADLYSFTDGEPIVAAGCWLACLKVFSRCRLSRMTTLAVPLVRRRIGRLPEDLRPACGQILREIVDAEAGSTSCVPVIAVLTDDAEPAHESAGAWLLDCDGFLKGGQRGLPGAIGAAPPPTRRLPPARPPQPRESNGARHPHHRPRSGEQLLPTGALQLLLSSSGQP